MVLAERWHALRRMASEQLKDPEVFWQKLDALPSLPADVLPPSAARALADLLSGRPGRERSAVALDRW